MIRIDDLTDAAGSWQFVDVRAAGAAWTRHEVVAELASAERRAQDHAEWVVLVMAYEAAGAFDPALRTAPAPPAGTPYVWWQSFAARRAVSPPEPVPSRVVDVERRPNRHPYRDAVRRIQQRIAAGDVYQVNLTDRFAGEYRGTPLDVYAALLGVQTCAFGAYVEMGERVVVSASPELFFHWDGPTITCRPMKGTAPRRPRPADDAAAAAALSASEKERAENTMIVDLLRNDLGKLAVPGSVRVPELFTRERYETVWQLTSTVCADVPDTVGLVDVFAALFPCGSVTGAPKVAAMEVIAALESDPRGVYCGAVTVLAPPGQGPRAVSSVPIRTAVLDPSTSRFEYGAGGAITWLSDPDAEDAEARTKTRILTRSHRRFELLETLRADVSGVHHVAEHLDRMEASAAWFGFPFDRDAAVELLAGVAPGADVRRVRLVSDAQGVLRLDVTPVDRGAEPVRLAVDDVVARSDDPFRCHKTTWRRHYDEARARHPGADDVVLVNEHGNVVETTIANLAYRRGERWYCPPLSDGGLPGVARGRAVAEGRLAERSLPVTELAACDELAVLNDLRGWRRAELAE